ncbi:MAG: PHP domain-containing protein [Candidatus Polarisedimenticolia bacterium]
MDRERIADALEEFALLLEMKGESPFKTRAYANAADLLRALDQDLGALVRDGRLTSLKGIGKALSEKIAALYLTGALPALDDLRAEVPQAKAIREFLRIPGLGIKKARILAESLQVASLGELEYACRENRLLELPGFGARAQEKILRGIERLKDYSRQLLLNDASRISETIGEAIGRVAGVREVLVAGPLRRSRETIDALALVAVGGDPGSILAAVSGLAGVQSAAARGGSRIEAALQGGIPLTLLMAAPGGRTGALLDATGSEAHVEALRRRAAGLGFELRPDGLYRAGRPRDTPEEEALYAALDMAFVPPELREGEEAIAMAIDRRLPALIRERDLRGIVHVHSTWSDGRLTIDEIVRRSAALGYDYVGISDHSRSARYARGLSVESLRQQQLQIDAAREAHPEIRVLKGSEVDILPDGTLDYPDEVLATFDFVVASVHSQFTLPEEEQTRRIVRALRHPRTTILGHPTGRLLLARDPYAVDLEAVLRAAAQEGVFVELNAHPSRLDLDSAACRRLRELGGRVAIDPDAHDAEGLGHARFGVGVARRAGLTAADVLNTTSASGLDAALRRAAR